MKTVYHSLMAAALFIAGTACSGAPEDSRETMEAPGCDLVVSFAPELVADGARALARINKATGCHVSSMPSGGFPVKLVAGLQDKDGAPICGGAEMAWYSDGALYQVVGVNVSRRRENCNTVESTIIHELFHIMTAERGQHSESGVYAAVSGNGLTINESTLETVCSSIECPAFNPE